MACEHKNLICTNNVFFCRDCGAMVPNPYEDKETDGQKEKPAEEQKTARKRKIAQK